MQTWKLLCLAVVVALQAAAQTVVGTINIPNLRDYKTLKCDLHLHTVFSDGDVWPTFRVQEAYRGGLDAIAFTDHLEYQPKAEYVSKDHNAAYQIAAKMAEEKGLILIRGAEITRSMPPGHLNALFITNGNALVRDDWKEAVAEAHKQGALIVWNHPGWESQQPDRIPKWYAEHTSLLEQGVLTGIEVVNSHEWYPDVFQWCVEKKVTMLGNSDSHQPTETEFNREAGKHRPLTLVFASEKTSEAIKDALLKRRTAVYFEHGLIGEESWLKQLFDQSISFNTTKIKMTGRERGIVRITNHSDIPFELVLVEANATVQFPSEMTLEAGKTIEFAARARRNGLQIDQKIEVKYEVRNLTVGPGKHLIAPFVFEVQIKP